MLLSHPAPYKYERHLKPMIEKSILNWSSEQFDYRMIRLRMRVSKATGKSLVQLLMQEYKLAELTLVA